MRRWRQHRQKVERLVRQIPIADEDALGDFREDYSKGIGRNFTGYSGYYHGVSPGASENNLMNYYYSQDALRVGYIDPTYWTYRSNTQDL